MSLNKPIWKLRDWITTLSFNKNAIHLLYENYDNINWYNLSSNSAIFELDYETMRKNN